MTKKEKELYAISIFYVYSIYSALILCAH